jgi:hypothetical protein
MIKIKDFVPQIEKKGGMFRPSKMQDFKLVIDEMNAWVLANNSEIDIFNIETVVLPNIHEPTEEGSEDTELWTGTSTSSSWHQLIRVWYRPKA